MIYVIPKDSHKAKGFPKKFWFGKKTISFWVIFDRTWMQSYPGEDKDDVSKLFGIGCLNLSYLLKGKPPHHYKSVRIGMDYSEEKDLMNVYQYLYDEGKRYFYPIAEFEFDKPYLCVVSQVFDGTDIKIYSKNNIQLASIITDITWGGISYLLGPYYGGTNPARIDTNINMQKL
jgi:hypothetical protein